MPEPEFDSTKCTSDECYKILGLDKGASDAEVKKAFRKVLHSPNQPITEKQFASKTAKMCQ